MTSVMACPSDPPLGPPPVVTGGRGALFAALLALGGWAIGLNLIHFADLVITVSERLRYGVHVWWFAPAFGGLYVSSWLVGTTATLAASFLVARGHGSVLWFRALVAIVGLLCLWELGATLWTTHPWRGSTQSFHTAAALISTAGLAASIPVALGRFPRIRLSRPAHAGLAATLIVGLLLAGSSMLLDAWDASRPQQFPPLRIALVAARPARVGESHPQLVTDGPRRFVLDPANRLVLTERDLRRVRRVPDPLAGANAPMLLALRLKGHAVDALRERSRLAMAQPSDGWKFDALYINDALAMVPEHQFVVVDGRLTIHSPSPASIEKLYRLLTVRRR